MKVEFTPDQEAFVRQAIQAGRLDWEEDAVQEALALWKERERARTVILAAMDTVETSLAAGQGRRITRRSMEKLGAGVKKRGRDRRGAERAATC
jgi:Arc/MetJ-type ribon-helix-helix transcriptional regulator